MTPSREPAPALSILEERVVALNPLKACIFHIRRRGNQDAGRRAETLQWGGRAHTIISGNASMQDLVRELSTFAVPQHPDRLPELVRIIFADAAATDAQIMQLLRSSTCLFVRPRVIMWWARHIAATYNIALDANALNAWDALGDGPVVPEQLRHAVVAPPTEEAAEQLAQVYIADREGPARVRQRLEDVRTAPPPTPTDEMQRAAEAAALAAAEHTITRRIEAATRRVATLTAAMTEQRRAALAAGRGGRGGRQHRTEIRLSRDLVRAALQAVSWTPDWRALWRHHRSTLDLATAMQRPGSPSCIEGISPRHLADYLGRNRAVLQPTIAAAIADHEAQEQHARQTTAAVDIPTTTQLQPPTAPPPTPPVPPTTVPTPTAPTVPAAAAPLPPPIPAGWTLRHGVPPGVVDNPAARWGRNFTTWDALLRSTAGQPSLTDSFLYMPLIVDALLPADQAMAAFPFQRPPGWHLLVARLRAGCAAHNITADQYRLDRPWHISTADQEHIVTTALPYTVRQVIAVLPGACKTRNPIWPDVSAALTAADENAAFIEPEDAPAAGTSNGTLS